MNRAILSCKCGSVPTYCEKAFKIIHPNEQVPVFYYQRSILRFAETFPRETEVHDFLLRYGKRRGRYGYLLEWDDEGKIKEVWNLLESKRLI